MPLDFTKLSAAVLTGGIIAMLSGFVAKQLVHPERLEHDAFAIAVEEGATPAPTESQTPAIEPIVALLASADVAKGEALTRNCTTCHTFDKGGANRVGPNLWGIVGAPHAAHEGYQYSSAMQSFAGKPWTYEELNHFIANPRSYAPGTKMSYAGLRRTQDRADLVAYLRTLADDPAPLPTQEEIDAATPAAHGEGASGAEGSVTPQPGGAQPAPAEPAEQQAPSPSEPAQPAQDQEGAVQPAGDLEQQLAAADVGRGQAVARQCVACHSFEQGGPNKVGPNLWGIVGAHAAHLDNYNYSQAMKDAAAKGMTWTLANLDAYIAAPKDFIPGNKMTYVGVKKESDRLALLAWLRQQGGAQ